MTWDATPVAIFQEQRRISLGCRVVEISAFHIRDSRLDVQMKFESDLVDFT